MTQRTVGNPSHQANGDHDSVWWHARTPCSASFHILGIPVLVESNAPQLVEMARDTFGDWGASPESPAHSGITLRLFLHLGVAAAAGSAPVVRAQRDYLLVSHGGSIGFTDRAAGFGAAFITHDLLDSPEIVRACFLEAMVVHILCKRRAGVLHAAAVATGGGAILLTGARGAGKSTLVYACLRSGFDVVAEDIVFVDDEGPPVCVWGNPWAIHLRPGTESLFPDLLQRGAWSVSGTDVKLRVKVNDVRPGAAVTRAPVKGVLLLERSPRTHSRLRPVAQDRVRAALSYLEGDPPLDRTAVDGAATRILATRYAALELGEDLAGAVHLVQNWLEVNPAHDPGRLADAP